jgi:hypothetical protein
LQEEKLDSGFRGLKICLALLLVACAAMILMTANGARAESDGYYTYSVSGDPAVATITAYSGPGGALTVPSTLGGYDVAAIGDWAFANCSSDPCVITSAILPHGITSIGNWSFYSCTFMSSVTVPDSVTSIGSCAFRYCSSLASITLPDSVITIGAGAFMTSGSLASATLPSNLVTVSDSLFSQCNALSSITIPNSVTSIGSNAFSSCPSLASVVIGSSVTSIGDSAFFLCDVLTSITFLEYEMPSVGSFWIFGIPSGARGHAYSDSNFPTPGNSFNGLTMGTVVPPEYEYNVADDEATITNYNGFGGSISIPSSLGGYPVVAIGYAAFSDKHSLTSVSIPDSVTSIGDYAFYDCPALTSVSIPDSVTSIGDRAFHMCPALTSILVDGDNQDYASEDGVLYDHDILTLIQYPTGKAGAFTVPDTVTTIAFVAFYGSASLTSATIPDSVIEIAESAFWGCTALASVTIGTGLASIGDYAFYDCSSLASISFLGMVAPTDVGGYWIEGTPEEIVGHAYASSDFPAPWIDESSPTFFGLKMGEVLVPPEFVYTLNADNEATITGYNGLGGDITIPSTLDGHSVVAIRAWAFANCTSLTSVIIPSCITSIGTAAFNGCTYLTAFTVDTSNLFYSSDVNGVLYDDAKATLVQYPIGNARTSFAIPDSVTSIGDWSFYLGTSLTSVTMPDSVTSIGIFAFAYCALTSVTIPHHVAGINTGVFFCCVALASVTIPDGVTSIGDYAFYVCGALTSVTIPDSVITIGIAAFASDGLTSVTIPGNVTGIAQWAFSGCTALTSIRFLGMVAPTSVGDNWIDSTSPSIRGHAYADSNFPAPGSLFNGLMMGSCIGEGPNAPTLISVNDRDSQFLLTWAAPTTGEAPTGYDVFYGTSTPDSKYGNTLNSSTLTVLITDLTPGSTYYFGVKAVNADGVSPLSNVLGATLQYYVTVDANGHGNPTQESQWVDAGSDFTVSVTTPDTLGPGHRWICTGPSSVTITNVDSPRTITFTWLEQFYITVDNGGHGTPSQASQWIDAGNAFSTSVASPADTNVTAGTRFVTPRTTLRILTVQAPSSLIFQWSPQYYLVVSTNIGNSTPSGWHDRGALVEILATLPSGQASEWYSWNGWTGTGAGSYTGMANPSMITMTAPITEIASWVSLYTYAVSNGNATITGYLGTSVSLNLPSMLFEYPVVGIGGRAFLYMRSITSITIPDSVTNIGTFSFYYCTALSSLTIGKGVTNIASYAFFYCTALTSVTIPDSVTNIGEFAFDNTALRSVIMGNGVTSIGNGAFMNCRDLTSVTIPASVNRIGYSVFEECTSLTSISFLGLVSPTVDNINWIRNTPSTLRGHAYAASNFPTPGNLFNGLMMDGVIEYVYTISEGKAIITGYLGAGGDITIPSTLGECPVIAIGPSSFGVSISLTSVVLPDSVTSIESHAFYSCPFLTSVTMGSGVTSISDYAFGECSSLTSITFLGTVAPIAVASSWIEGTPETIRGYAYASSDFPSPGGDFHGLTMGPVLPIPEDYIYLVSSGRATIIGYIGAGGIVTIPSTLSGYPVVAIGNAAFRDCGSLTSITIPEGVTSIGNVTFSDCTTLTSVTIPDGLTFMGDSAFAYCTALTSIAIPGKVASIGQGAFLACSALRSVIIGNSVTSIGVNAFSSCTALISVTMGSGVTSIGDSAFNGCIALTSITIPDNVISIGEEAFASCNVMTSITVGASVNSIGMFTFFDCESLTSITFLGKVAPASVGRDWLLCGSGQIPAIGHALASSDFPAPGGYFHGLPMGDNIPEPPGAPTVLSAIERDLQATVTWAAPSNSGSGPISGYKVFYGTTTTPITQYGGTLDPSTLTVTVAGLTPGLTYYFGVKAVNAIGDSPLSNVLRATEQFYVTVNANGHGSPTQASQWVDAGSDFVVSVTSPDLAGMGHQWLCTSATSISFTNIQAPQTATFTWVEQFYIAVNNGGHGTPTQSSQWVNAGSSFTTSVTSPADINVSAATRYVTATPSLSIPDVQGPRNLTFAWTAQYWVVFQQTGVGSDYAGIVMTINGASYASGGYASWFSIGAAVSYTYQAKLVVDAEKSYAKISTDASPLRVSAPATVIATYVPQYAATDFIYTVRGDVATIVGYIGAGGDITIPNSLGGYQVAAIGNRSFDGCMNITSVSFGETIISIGVRAFNSCGNLTSVTFGDSVTIIRDGAFAGSGLRSVDIGKGVTVIEASAFQFCGSLVSVTISDSVQRIGHHAFDTCRALTTLTIGKNVTTIENNAFAWCTALVTVIVPDSVTSLGTESFACCYAMTSITIGTGLNSIGIATFWDDTSLTSISFNGMTAPTSVGRGWLSTRYGRIPAVGHALPSSNFPAPGGNFAGLPMGDYTVDAPILVSAIGRNDQFTLTWSASPGASGYRVFYGNNTPPTMQYGPTLNSSILSVVVSGLSPGRSYYFGVRAVVGNSASPLSNAILASMQYYVAVNANGHGSPTQVSQWVDAGSDFAVSVTSPESAGTGHRWLCTSVTSYSFTNIWAPQTATFTWVEQYYVIVENGGHGTPSEGSQWVNAGNAFSTSVTSPADTDLSAGVRYVTSATTLNLINVRAPETVQFTWSTQYLLRISANYGTVSPENNSWFDPGNLVLINAVSPSSVPGEQYIWNGWTGTGTGSYTGLANDVYLYMNGSISETASWTHQVLPAQVTGLMVITGDAQVILSWDVPSGTIDCYVVYMDTIEANRVAGTSVTLGDLVNGRSYSFTVAAHGADGNGPNSTAVTATPVQGGNSLRVGIDSPLNNAIIGSRSIPISWTVFGSAMLVQTEVNLVEPGSPGWTIVQGNSTTLEASHDGVCLLEVRVTDVNSEVSTASVYVQVDTTTPYVMRHSPSVVAESTLPTILVSFSKEMDMSATSITVTVLGAVMPGTMSWVTSLDLTFVPAMAIGAGMTCYVVVEGKDLAGHPLSDSWTFKIGRVGAARGSVEYNGGPLRGAAVMMFHIPHLIEGTSGFQHGSMFGAESKVWNATTDAQGNYCIYDLPVGTYTLTIEKEGYATQTKTITMTEADIDAGGISIGATSVSKVDNTLLYASIGLIVVVIAVLLIFFLVRRKKDQGNEKSGGNKGQGKK